jgi:hypothetical protein
MSQSLADRIADTNGKIRTEFASSRSAPWARRQMEVRYQVVAPQSSDPTWHPASICFRNLQREHARLTKCFDGNGVLNHLALSQYLGTQTNSGPLGDGFGCDFLTNGELNTDMTVFKQSLITAFRNYQLAPSPVARRSKNPGSDTPELAIAVRMVRLAYKNRATLHHWTSCRLKGVEYTGSEMQKRWIAYRTFVTMCHIGADEGWAWSNAKCDEAFGAIDMPT